MSLIDYSEQPRVNPLDVVERVAAGNGWSFERAGEDEITLLVTGKWSDYQVSYTWMFDIEALHLACAFELKVPDRSRGEVQQLISLINEQLVTVYLKDAYTQVRIFERTGKPVRDVSLPGIGTAVGFGGKRKYKATFYAFTSYNTPAMQRRFFITLLVLVTIAFVAVLFPFYGAVFWALILAMLFAPLQRAVQRRIPNRPNLAALLTL